MILISYHTIIKLNIKFKLLQKVSAVCVNDLVVDVLLERGLKPEDVDILIGIDDGQGILKVSVSCNKKNLPLHNIQVSIVLICKNTDNVEGRSHYSEVL